MSSQSPSNSSISTDQGAQGENPAAAFGPNEWLVDEIYQQYLQDPNSVDRAWWDFFADYKPGGGSSAATAAKPSDGSTAADAAPAQPGTAAAGLRVPPVRPAVPQRTA